MGVAAPEDRGGANASSPHCSHLSLPSPGLPLHSLEAWSVVHQAVSGLGHECSCIWGQGIYVPNCCHPLAQVLAASFTA